MDRPHLEALFYILVGIYDLNSCWAHLGSPEPYYYYHQINLGWCKEMAHKGSLIHEIYHSDLAENPRSTQFFVIILAKSFSSPRSVFVSPLPALPLVNEIDADRTQNLTGLCKCTALDGPNEVLFLLASFGGCLCGKCVSSRNDNAKLALAWHSSLARQKNYCTLSTISATT